jgi:plasmid stabilization system protein ParE
MSGFVLHAEALTDLDEIWEYIPADNPGAADGILEEIYEAILSLVPFPQKGHRRSDLTSRPLRFHSVREFLIAYAPDEKPMHVLAILHGRRNPRVIAHFFVKGNNCAPAASSSQLGARGRPDSRRKRTRSWQKTRTPRN